MESPHFLAFLRQVFPFMRLDVAFFWRTLFSPIGDRYPKWMANPNLEPYCGGLSNVLGMWKARIVSVCISVWVSGLFWDVARPGEGLCPTLLETIDDDDDYHYFIRLEPTSVSSPFQKTSLSSQLQKTSVFSPLQKASLPSPVQKTSVSSTLHKTFSSCNLKSVINLIQSLS